MSNTANNTEELQQELKSLEEELAQIKDGIKRCKGTMIIDGNDMYDWGWLIQEEVNKECRERFGFSLNEYPNNPSLTSIINKKINDDTPWMGCPNCKTTLLPVFMVRDELWEQSGMEGWPCFLCFELAIGRRLRINDLKPAPLCNHMLPLGYFIGTRQPGKMS